MSRERRRSIGPEAAVTADKGKTLETIRNLWPHIWPQGRPDLKRAIGLALMSLIAGKVITVLVPFLYKWATDALAPLGRDVQFLSIPVMLVIAYGLGRIMMQGFNQLRDGLFAAVAMHAVRDLASIAFRHLHALSLRFHLSRRTGGLSRVIERGAKGIETIVRIVILTAIPTAIEFALMAFVLGLEFDWTYVAVIGVTVWLYVWFSVRASDWRIGIRREMNAADTDSMSKAVDSLLNYETVKYFSNEKMEADRYDRAMARYESASTRTYTSLAWLNMGQAVIYTLGMIVVMVMSVRAVLDGTQTIGHFVMLNAMMMQLMMPLNFIGMIYRDIKQGLADIEAMFAVINIPPEVVDKPDAPAIAITAGAVSFENVEFHYDPERPILKGISFSVPAGKTVAIVGPSGAGKSTISRLLFRFYDVASGRVVIDGQDIRDVDQASLRAAIGMVPQDTVLFNDTIAYNIAYGRPGASREDIVEAARMAQISDFIEKLPKGFDTEVGERGLKLSGGEKQRVAIARTILKAPPILMLDEATSALDTHTEREIQAALDQVSKNRTTLVIAHRLSTVVNADEIIVLEDGLIVERGTHDALLAQNGLYASMWFKQRAADEAREKLLETEAGDTLGIVTRARKLEPTG
ncbi:MAG: ABC transporter ATP-binding protein/permease [Hyphomicrobiaceae bacterium]|nr:ABC transporter ATP-binding protein/permease [Hyphomicrobiaceae bacterium]